MSYSFSAPLQEAIYTRLSTYDTLTAVVGTHIYDALPSGALPDLYVSLGPETARDTSDITGAGAIHELSISVISTQSGFYQAKEIAGHICDALLGEDIILTRGSLVFLNFQRANAKRDTDSLTRRIDLSFVVQVSEN